MKRLMILFLCLIPLLVSGIAVAIVFGGPRPLPPLSSVSDPFASAGRDVPVILVSGIGHMGLTLTPAGVRAVVQALSRLSPR